MKIQIDENTLPHSALIALKAIGYGKTPTECVLKALVEAFERIEAQGPITKTKRTDDHDALQLRDANERHAAMGRLGTRSASGS